MNRFEYATPTDLDEAVGLLGNEHDRAVVLAGGTDLLSLMKDFVLEPERVVSLSRLDDLSFVQERDGGLVIGARATLDDLLEMKGLPDMSPALFQAASEVESPQMRAMGTVGGELLQRPRCWYFRRGMGLLAEQGGQPMADVGDARGHAVFLDAGPARFVCPSRLAPVLIAQDAIAVIRGRNGTRECAVKDLYRIPQKTDERELTLAPDEILTEIRIARPRSRSSHVEVRHRRGLDWPEASAAAALEIEGGQITDARLVLGHVAPLPWEVDLGEILNGKKPTPENISAAADAAVVGARPGQDNAHKVELARVSARRALTQAAN